jgi:uncharacterized protein YdbL (DUF1318 family)
LNPKARLALLSPALLAAACVTINVYFPGPAAAKAADKIINRVWGKQAQPGGSAPEGTPAPSSTPLNRHAFLEPGRARFDLGRIFTDTLGQALAVVIPDAEAAANFDISSPAIKQIQQSLRTRFHQHLEQYFNSGAVGLTNDGFIAVHDLSAVPLAKRNSVKQLVSDNNADLRALYHAVAVANNHPEWENKIRKTFARRWIAKARAGWYYQNQNGQWVKKQ